MDEYPYGVREALKELVDMESECRLQLDKLTQKEQQIYRYLYLDQVYQ